MLSQHVVGHGSVRHWRARGMKGWGADGGHCRSLLRMLVPLSTLFAFTRKRSGRHVGCPLNGCYLAWSSLKEMSLSSRFLKEPDEESFPLWRKGTDLDSHDSAMHRHFHFCLIEALHSNTEGSCNHHLTKHLESNITKLTFKNTDGHPCGLPRHP